MHNLVVGDGVEEVVVTRVKHRMHHATSNSKHGTTSVLDLDVEGSVTSVYVLNLTGVTTWDERRRSIVSSRQVLWTTSVLSSGHGNSLGKSSEQEDLGKSEGRDVR
eukprot:509841_1